MQREKVCLFDRHAWPVQGPHRTTSQRQQLKQHTHSVPAHFARFTVTEISQKGQSLRRFVALTATNPAKLYGLYPRKGSIFVGADADIALWDPKRKVTIDNAKLHHNVDYTPYQGIEVQGWPVLTLSRGKVVSREFSLTGEAGWGQFLPCDKPIM